MLSATIQFHMLFDEQIDFVAEVMSRFSLAAELERFFPNTRCEVTSAAELAHAVGRFGHVDCIWLLYKPPRARKHERFYLKVGRQKHDQMEQSHLGADTDKAEAFKVLQKVAQHLKKRTTAGIWVIGASGHVGFAKSFRYSLGAAHSSRTGMLELKAIGFTQSFRVDPPGDGRDEVTRLKRPHRRTSRGDMHAW